ncbi:unnamed protein product [Lymnaea stagnalis]|uniref:Mitochondrial transcription rescue factor 1 C-terminal domain-containing protein n=1 Tax=Lymnaea stagnalis TaxID=6523 RepID=A0AAV2IHV9_LYMST
MMILIKLLKNMTFLDAKLLHRVSVQSSRTSCHSISSTWFYIWDQSPRLFSKQQIIFPDTNHHSFLKGQSVLSLSSISCHHHCGFHNITQTMNRSASSIALYKQRSHLNVMSIIHQNLFQKRHKSSKKQSSTDENLSDSDDDDELNEDDFDAPPKFKVMKIHTPSLRSDAIISHSLDVARNRLEEAFFGPGILLNGAKMTKKAAKMDEGDYVDLVMEKVEDQLKVKRVKLLKIYPEKTSNDKFTVKIRVWKAPFLVANPKKEQRDS